MTALVTEFQPPEGLHPHEAPFLLGEEEEKLRFFRALLTASLELVDMGIVRLPAGAKRPLVDRRPDVALTPFQEIVTASLAAEAPAVASSEIETSIKRRLAGLGWWDESSARLTSEGEAARGRLRGYREYLRRAMADRLHLAAVEGVLDRETEFAAGLGIIGMPNLLRAISIRLGETPGGVAGAAFAVLGGKVSEQHGGSGRLSRMSPSALIFGSYVAFILAGFALFIIFIILMFVVGAIDALVHGRIEMQ